MTELYIITALFLGGVFGLGVPAFLEEIGFFELRRINEREERKNKEKS